MRLGKCLRKHWRPLWPAMSWTLSDTLTLCFIPLCLCVGVCARVHALCARCMACSDLIRFLCLCAVFVFLRKRAWHEACWSWGVHAEGLSSRETGFNRGRSRWRRKNTRTDLCRFELSWVNLQITCGINRVRNTQGIQGHSRSRLASFGLCTFLHWAVDEWMSSAPVVVFKKQPSIKL